MNEIHINQDLNLDFNLNNNNNNNNNNSRRRQMSTATFLPSRKKRSQQPQPQQHRCFSKTTYFYSWWLIFFCKLHFVTILFLLLLLVNDTVVVVDAFLLNDHFALTIPWRYQNNNNHNNINVLSVTRRKPKPITTIHDLFHNNKNLIRLHLSEPSSYPSTATTATANIESSSNNNNNKEETLSTFQKTTIPQIVEEENKQTTVTNLKPNNQRSGSRRTWQENFELLKQYKEEWGDCLVPRNYKQDKKLGQWVTTQRQHAKHGRLKPEQQHKLDTIGFSWDARTDIWDSMLEPLQEFHEEFGHCNVEQQQDKFQSRQTLAVWVMTQRQRRPLLTNKQQTKLDTLGFVWDNVGTARGDYQWEERFEALQEYQRSYGHTRVPQRSASSSSASSQNNNNHNNIKKLGKWVSTQRQQYQKGILRQDRKDKLNNIGFLWKLRDHPNSTNYKKVDQIWMKHFETLKDYKMIHNDTNVPFRYEKDPKLGRWVYHQRRHYRLGTLKKSRQEMLETVIGFEWNVQEKAFENQWMDQYQDLVKFQNKHGHVNVPRSSSTTSTSTSTSSNNHPNLYNWLLWQRTYFANNKLELERKELLEKLGVDLKIGPGCGNTTI